MRPKLASLKLATPLILALLAACGGGGQKPDVPRAGAYRTGEGQLASAALFDPARFADVWHVVAAYGPDAACGPLSETWTPQGPGRFLVTGTYCGPSGARAFKSEARVTGPGRITRSGPPGSEEIWVLWVDGDYRIAAIGAPSGDYGRILSRSPGGRSDLVNAAREVLDFNGYDLSRLAPL